MNSTTRFWLCMLVAVAVIVPYGGAVLAATPEPPAGAVPSLGQVLWTFDVDPESGRPLSSGNYLDAAGPELCAVTAYRDLQPGSPYAFEWYHNGVLIRYGEGEIEKTSGNIVECHHWIVGSMDFVLHAGDLTAESDPLAMVQVKPIGG